MTNGIYAVVFGSSLGFGGAGSIELRNGRLRGGDDEFLYLGTYDVRGESIRANVSVRRFLGSTESIFGDIDTFTLDLIGKVSGATFYATGIVAEMPDLSMTVQGHPIVGVDVDHEVTGDASPYSRLSALIARTTQLEDLKNLADIAKLDVEACLNKLRKAGEKIARQALSTIQSAPPVADFNGAIGVLQGRRVVSGKAIGCLHTIRVLGNIASHSTIESLTNDDLHSGIYALASVAEEMLQKGII